MGTDKEADVPDFPARSQRSDPEMAALYDKAFAQRGNVPNMFRVMAHRPEIFATMQAHFGAVLNTGTVSTKLKELIIVRTSQVNVTPYCLASHTILAKGLGWSDDQLAHLADWPSANDFTPAEKAALRLAETVTRDAHAVTTSSSPNCAPSTPKAKSWNCSAPLASSTTSTASTTPCRWSPPNPAKAVARATSCNS
jgi:AhpD family alkylhydroperoxidase